MADTVNTLTLLDNDKFLVIKCMNLSDGTGESAVVKVNMSTIAAAMGIDKLQPDYLYLDKILFSINGMSVNISVVHTATTRIAQLTGWGKQEWKEVGGIVTKFAGGSTGNITFTTSGQTAGSSYDISLFFRKHTPDTGPF